MRVKRTNLAITKLTTGWLGIFTLLALSLAILTPQQAAASNYPDPTCLTNAGNANVVVFVKILNADGTFNSYADHFKFKIKSYNRSPGTSEGNDYENWKHNSILYRHDGMAVPKGDSTNTLEVKKVGGAMAAGKGNLCKPYSTSASKVAAYAFRDGDGTSQNCFSGASGATRTGCAYNPNVREDNNNSWMLSCLGSNATAYQLEAIDVYGVADGNFVAGEDGTSGSIMDWVSNDTVKLYSYPGQELNGKERRIIFVYKLEQPPKPKKVFVTPNLTVGPDVEIGESATFTQSATVDGFPTTSQWGWNNKAVQKAVNTGANAYRVDYDAKQGDHDGYATVYLRCGDDTYQSNCSGHGKNIGTKKDPNWKTYHCDGGAYKDDCGSNYAWSCTDGGYGPDITRSGVNGDTQPANCKLYRYYCKDTSGNYYDGGNYRFKGFSGRTDNMCFATDTGS